MTSRVEEETMNQDRLREFLVEANRAGYASDQTTISNDPDGSHTIVFESDGWRFEDNFFGGEPYGGCEVIAVGGRVEWMMLYYGWVSGTDLTTDAVYKFLRTALMRVPPEKPYRGPDSFVDGDLEYRNRVDGDVANFDGVETILDRGSEIYRARYFGGLLDQRPGE
jgi:uncharacterized protein DUF5680